jgi:hypothetical protein
MKVCGPIDDFFQGKIAFLNMAKRGRCDLLKLLVETHLAEVTVKDSEVSLRI